MTEWEKLQTGQLYNDFDRGLFKRRIAAKRPVPRVQPDG